MRRILLLLAAACGSSVSGARPPEAGSPVTMSCRPLGPLHLAGSPVSVVVELRNVGADDLVLHGMTIPWAYRHAAKFTITSPGPFSAEALTLSDPGTYPEWPLARGQSDRGDLDVTWRFVDANQKSFVDRPGTYTIVGHAGLVTEDGKRQIDAVCGPFDLEILPRTGEMGASLDLAEKAARDAKYDLAS
jgi:hypothetical protein